MIATRSEKALKYYNQFVEAEDAGDLIAAHDALRRSSRLGEPMAFHVMAYYEMGKECPRIAWALIKYRMAAKAGFAPSAWNLALYYKGKGKAGLFRKWMACAAALGDPEAEAELRTLP